MKIAFAGLRHDHIFAIHNMALGNKEFTVAGAFEQDKDAASRAKDAGVDCCYPSYEALLSDDSVEAVALGGCFADRGPMAIQALKAGKHVIADKPLCTDLAQIDEIKKLAYQNNKKVSCMFSLRYNQKICGVLELVKTGALGEVNNIYFGGQHPLMYGRRPMWYFEKGRYGGVINDIAVHGVDLLSYLFGIDTFDVIAARSWNRYAENEPHFLDSAQFMLKAPNGAGILADVSYAVPEGMGYTMPHYWQFNVWATGGVLDFSIGKNDILFFKKGCNEPTLIEKQAPKTDYLSDFLHMVREDADLILPMEDVLASTAATLKIQSVADKM